MIATHGVFLNSQAWLARAKAGSYSTDDRQDKIYIYISKMKTGNAQKSTYMTAGVQILNTMGKKGLRHKM